ncbi:hypothetical protein Pcinc_042345 [Petrolisthes cinctipes]|uniref:Uncharacterized protein n=1 Tax=Petrolisthes cinctipes TaxID=88211 RepID=A0AAE1EIY3_PETCI|nr:hypothetical protein Pcinc_042345 [Petrolisthes cinctipes]
MHSWSDLFLLNNLAAVVYLRSYSSTQITNPIPPKQTLFIRLQPRSQPHSSQTNTISQSPTPITNPISPKQTRLQPRLPTPYLPNKHHFPVSNPNSYRYVLFSFPNTETSNFIFLTFQHLTIITLQSPSLPSITINSFLCSLSFTTIPSPHSTPSQASNLSLTAFTPHHRPPFPTPHYRPPSPPHHRPSFHITDLHPLPITDLHSTSLTFIPSPSPTSIPFPSPTIIPHPQPPFLPHHRPPSLPHHQPPYPPHHLPPSHITDHHLLPIIYLHPSSHTSIPSLSPTSIPNHHHQAQSTTHPANQPASQPVSQTTWRGCSRSLGAGWCLPSWREWSSHKHGQSSVVMGEVRRGKAK